MALLYTLLYTLYRHLGERQSCSVVLVVSYLLHFISTARTFKGAPQEQLVVFGDDGGVAAVRARRHIHDLARELPLLHRLDDNSRTLRLC